MDSKKKISSKKYYCYSRTLISPVLWRIILILSYLVGLVTDLPVPQVVVRSQSLLYNEQPGRQVDLTKVLPTTEVFWLNLEESYFACQVNASEKYLKIFKLSRLCDGNEDCYQGSDELSENHKCSSNCETPCGPNGVCLKTRPNDDPQCHCNDGFGGLDCSQSDVNECKYRPCAIHAECTNTLGSFTCACREGYEGNGFMCQPSANINEVPYEESQEVLDNVETLIKDADGKFEDPNIDLSILPPEINSDGTNVIEAESTAATTTQSSVILSVTTFKNSVMDVVITPDTSSVEGTTLVVEKIKEIIDDIVRKENSGEDLSTSDDYSNVSDDDNANISGDSSLEDTMGQNNILARENIAESTTAKLASNLESITTLSTETPIVTSTPLEDLLTPKTPVSTSDSILSSNDDFLSRNRGTGSSAILYFETTTSGDLGTKNDVRNKNTTPFTTTKSSNGDKTSLDSKLNSTSAIKPKVELPLISNGNENDSKIKQEKPPVNNIIDPNVISSEKNNQLKDGIAENDPISDSISTSTSSISGTASVSATTPKLTTSTETSIESVTSFSEVLVPDHEVPEFINDHAHGPPTVEDDKEPVSIAEIISETVQNYVERGSLETPCELIVSIKTTSDLSNPEIQVEPAIIDGNDSLKATVKLPGEPENSIEFKVTVPKLSDGKSIDIPVLSEVISKAFDEAVMPQITTIAPISAMVTENFIDTSFPTTKVSDVIVTTPSSTPMISTTEKLIAGENRNIAGIISETIVSYLDRGNLETPCELVINIKTKNDQMQPEIQVEPAIIDDGDSLKATVKFPGETENSVEFKVAVPKATDGKSIDIPALSEAISKAFDDALMPHPAAPLSAAVTDDFIDTSFETSKNSETIVTTPSSTSTKFTTEKSFAGENKNIAEIISETVDAYVDKGNLETPCELVVNIKTKNDLSQPEIQVEPAIIDDGDSLKATVEFPGETENSVEFKVTVPKATDGKSIDIPALSEVISKAFDDALMPHPAAPLSTAITDDFIDTSFETSKVPESIVTTLSSTPTTLTTEKLYSGENKNIAEIISETVDSYVDRGNLETPSELVVNIKAKNNLLQPEIQVEPSLIGDDDSLKASVEFPGETDNSVEFTVSVPKSTDGKSIDVLALSEVISKSFDDALMQQATLKTPTSTFVTGGFIGTLFSTEKDPDTIVTTPSSTPTTFTSEKAVVENKNIAEIISETVDSYVDRGNLETPCELVVNIKTKNDLSQPEIQVEPAIIDDGDSLKATIEFPGKTDNSVEFKVSVPKSSDGKSIDIPALSEAISKAFDNALMPHPEAPLSKAVTDDIIDTSFETSNLPESTVTTPSSTPSTFTQTTTPISTTVTEDFIDKSFSTSNVPDSIVINTIVPPIDSSTTEGLFLGENENSGRFGDNGVYTEVPLLPLDDDYYYDYGEDHIMDDIPEEKPDILAENAGIATQRPIFTTPSSTSKIDPTNNQILEYDYLEQNISEKPIVEMSMTEEPKGLKDNISVEDTLGVIDDLVKDTLGLIDDIFEEDTLDDTVIDDKITSVVDMLSTKSIIDNSEIATISTQRPTSTNVGDLSLGDKNQVTNTNEVTIKPTSTVGQKEETSTFTIPVTFPSDNLAETSEMTTKASIVASTPSLPVTVEKEKENEIQADYDDDNDVSSIGLDNSSTTAKTNAITTETSTQITTSAELPIKFENDLNEIPPQSRQDDQLDINKELPMQPAIQPITESETEFTESAMKKLNPTTKTSLTLTSTIAAPLDYEENQVIDPSEESKSFLDKTTTSSTPSVKDSITKSKSTIEQAVTTTVLRMSSSIVAPMDYGDYGENEISDPSFVVKPSSPIVDRISSIKTSITNTLSSTRSELDLSMQTEDVPSISSSFIPVTEIDFTTTTPIPNSPTKKIKDTTQTLVTKELISSTTKLPSNIDTDYDSINQIIPEDDIMDSKKPELTDQLKTTLPISQSTRESVIESITRMTEISDPISVTMSSTIPAIVEYEDLEESSTPSVLDSTSKSLGMIDETTAKEFATKSSTIAVPVENEENEAIIDLPNISTQSPSTSTQNLPTRTETSTLTSELDHEIPKFANDHAHGPPTIEDEDYAINIVEDAILDETETSSKAPDVPTLTTARVLEENTNFEDGENEVSVQSRENIDKPITPTQTKISKEPSSIRVQTTFKEDSNSFENNMETAQVTNSIPPSAERELVSATVTDKSPDISNTKGIEIPGFTMPNGVSQMTSTQVANNMIPLLERESIMPTDSLPDIINSASSIISKLERESIMSTDNLPDIVNTQNIEIPRFTLPVEKSQMITTKGTIVESFLATAPIAPSIIAFPGEKPILPIQPIKTSQLSSSSMSSNLPSIIAFETDAPTAPSVSLLKPDKTKSLPTDTITSQFSSKVAPENESKFLTTMPVVPSVILFPEEGPTIPIQPTRTSEMVPLTTTDSSLILDNEVKGQLTDTVPFVTSGIAFPGDIPNLPKQQAGATPLPLPTIASPMVPDSRIGTKPIFTASAPVAPSVIAFPGEFAVLPIQSFESKSQSLSTRISPSLPNLGVENENGFSAMVPVAPTITSSPEGTPSLPNQPTETKFADLPITTSLNNFQSKKSTGTMSLISSAIESLPSVTKISPLSSDFGIQNEDIFSASIPAETSITASPDEKSAPVSPSLPNQTTKSPSDRTSSILPSDIGIMSSDIGPFPVGTELLSSSNEIESKDGFTKTVSLVPSVTASIDENPIPNQTKQMPGLPETTLQTSSKIDYDENLNQFANDIEQVIPSGTTPNPTKESLPEKPDTSVQTPTMTSLITENVSGLEKQFEVDIDKIPPQSRQDDSLNFDSEMFEIPGQSKIDVISTPTNIINKPINFISTPTTVSRTPTKFVDQDSSTIPIPSILNPLVDYLLSDETSVTKDPTVKPSFVVNDQRIISSVNDLEPSSIRNDQLSTYLDQFSSMLLDLKPSSIRSDQVSTYLDQISSTLIDLKESSIRNDQVSKSIMDQFSSVLLDLKPSSIRNYQVSSSIMNPFSSTSSELESPIQTEDIPMIISSFVPATETDNMITTPILDRSTQKVKESLETSSTEGLIPSTTKLTPNIETDYEDVIKQDKNVKSERKETSIMIPAPLDSSTQKMKNGIFSTTVTSEQEVGSGVRKIAEPSILMSISKSMEISDELGSEISSEIEKTAQITKIMPTATSQFDAEEIKPTRKISVVNSPINTDQSDVKPTGTSNKESVPSISSSTTLSVPSITERKSSTPPSTTTDFSSTSKPETDTALSNGIIGIPPQSREDTFSEIELSSLPTDKGGNDMDFVSVSGIADPYGISTTISKTTENIIKGTSTISSITDTTGSIVDIPVIPIEISYQICEEVYIFCDSLSITCQRRYDECKSDPNLDLEPEKGQPQDDILINGISECQKSFFTCQGENCISQVRGCLLKTLEDARQRRLKSELKQRKEDDDDEEEVLSKSEEILELDIEALELYNNFTDCVSEYSTCLDLRGMKVFCKQKFNNCSLDILSETEMSNTALKEPSFVIGSTKNEGLEGDEHELSADLFICIQEFMMCNMNSGKNCMRSYNFCTLKVLDNYHENKAVENSVGRQGSEEDSVLPEIVEDVDESAEIENLEANSNCGTLDDFGSFSGRPASSTADCTWDFFSCTNKFGTWPDNKICCEERFDRCCEKVNGSQKKKVTMKPTTFTATEQTGTSLLPSYKPSFAEDNPADNIAGEGLQLIDCVWKYMGCARANRPDAECKSEFNQCSKGPLNPGQGDNSDKTIAVTGLGPPPGSALKPNVELELQESDLTEELQDSEFLQCIKRLYNCQNAGIKKENCQNVELCVHTPKEEELEIVPPNGSYLPPAASNDGAANINNRPPLIDPAPPVSNGHGRPVGSFTDEELFRPSTFSTVASTTAYTTPIPVIGEKPTNPQCIWAYFGCGAKHNEKVCKQRFDNCMSGQSFDYQICKHVDDNPQEYLVPHPEDCTKFYSCQNLGWRGGYIAHLMDCPPTTGFDTKLRICNYIRALPRCNKEQERKLFEEVEGLIARQTRYKKQILDVSGPKVIQKTVKMTHKQKTTPKVIEISQFRKPRIDLLPIQITQNKEPEIREKPQFNNSKIDTLLGQLAQNSEPEVLELPQLRKSKIESFPDQSAQPVKAPLRRTSENVSVPIENSTTKQNISQPLCFLLILVHLLQGARIHTLNR